MYNIEKLHREKRRLHREPRRKNKLMKKFLHIKNIYFLLVFVFLFSCKKEKITIKHAEFVGRWIELSGENTYHELYIQDDSQGTYYECTRGIDGDCADT